MDDERIIKCPKCGKTVRVEIEDVMDISVEDGDHMTRWCVGQCPACKASLDWNERFEFVELTEVNVSEYDFFGDKEGEDEE